MSCAYNEYILGSKTIYFLIPIRQWVEKQKEDIVPMAFDMEWPFSFQTGPGKSSVIQICVDEKCCYVYQLTNVKKLPSALVALINHPKVRLHGVNIKA